MRNDNFFKHDASASDDEKIMMLIEKEGMKGYGAYWILMEALRKQENLCSSFAVLHSLAKRAKVRKEYLIHIIKDFGLFVMKEDSFYSLGMKRRMTKYLMNANYLSVKAEDNLLIDNAKSAIPTRVTEQNRKEKILTVVDEYQEGQIPLRPCRGWEALVDEMAASEDYMNQAGMHSGMGLLYLSNRERIVRLFKEQICLQGKQERMISLSEVKSYFSNFVASGSVTNQKIRAALKEQSDCRREQDPYRFETIVGGKRTFMGHAIPPDAPPRPDAAAVWDAVRRRWAH